MALFEGVKRIEGSRSHTELIKSGHNSPAEEWLVDNTFLDPTMSGVFRDGILFNYQYGGPGQMDVVIPKGRVVGVKSAQKDFVTKKQKVAITLPGIATNGNTIGMVPYNITKDYLQMDRFGGNAPSIVTIDYVKLPYIPGVEPNAQMNKTGLLAEEQAITVDGKNPWGAVIGAGIVEGDYLKATASGRLTKWDPAADKFHDVVGQVLAHDFNQETWGWEKWMMLPEEMRKDDDMYINKSGASNLPGDAGYPYDPAYAAGTRDYPQGYQTGLTDQPTGIAGLSNGQGNYDGFGRNDTEYADMVLGSVPAGVADNTIVAVNAINYAGVKIENLREGVQIFIDGVAVAADKLTIDYKNGQLSVTVMAADAGKAITGTYKAMHYGNPTYLDFKGVAGALFVLLKK